MGDSKPRSGAHKSKPVLAQDIAEKLGVSVSTVSRAFTPHSRISDETRAKILSVAETVGYQPDPFARSLNKQKSNIVCVFVSEIFNPFFPELMTVMTEELQKEGFIVMLFHISPQTPLEKALPGALRYKPRFVIITTATTDFSGIDPDKLGDTEIILFNRYVPGGGTMSVTCDNFKGGYELADLLLDTGHRKLAFIAGTPGATTSIDRGQGFKDRCRMAGIDVIENSSATAFSYEGGYDAAKQLHAQRGGIDAIFCANDIMALGAIDALRYECSLNVPEDISVVGFDDLQMAGWPCHNLTTYRYPKRQMISALLDLIEDLASASDIKPVNKIVVGGLVPRGSHRDRRQKNVRTENDTNLSKAGGTR